MITRRGVSALPATLQGSVAIVRRCADHVPPGHFHLRHRRRGVFTFDARGAAGEKLLRAQRADDHVFVCAQFRRASNHDGPTLCCFVNGRRYRQTRYVGSRCAVCRQVDRHRQQVDTCWWGNRWKSSHRSPNRAMVRNPRMARAQDSCRHSNTTGGRWPNEGESLAPSESRCGRFWHCPRMEIAARRCPFIGSRGG